MGRIHHIGLVKDINLLGDILFFNSTVYARYLACVWFYD
jgi:hypothetical protein